MAGVNIPRRRVAQACLAAAAAATFLPWQSSGEESTLGSGVAEGRIAFVVCLVTVGLVQAAWRPAWIGAGFAGAITIRRILDGGTDPAVGLWVAATVCIVAAVLLIWDMFSGVSASGNEDKPPGHGLSGPLGRRRR